MPSPATRVLNRGPGNRAFKAGGDRCYGGGTGQRLPHRILRSGRQSRSVTGRDGAARGAAFGVRAVDIDLQCIAVAARVDTSLLQVPVGNADGDPQHDRPVGPVALHLQGVDGGGLPGPDHASGSRECRLEMRPVGEDDACLLRLVVGHLLGGAPAPPTCRQAQENGQTDCGPSYPKGIGHAHATILPAVLHPGVVTNTRQLKGSDAGPVARIHAEARSAYYAAAGLPQADAPVAAQAADRVALWQGFITDPGTSVFGTADGDEIVGFVAWALTPKAAAIHPAATELLALYVRPDHWRQGRGADLHELFLEHLAAQQVTVAALEVWSLNEGAIAFFSARGWQAHSAARPGPLGAPFVMMQLDLALSRDHT